MNVCQAKNVLSVLSQRIDQSTSETQSIRKENQMDDPRCLEDNKYLMWISASSNGQHCTYLGMDSQLIPEQIYLKTLSKAALDCLKAASPLTSTVISPKIKSCHTLDQFLSPIYPVIQKIKIPDDRSCAVKALKGFLNELKTHLNPKQSEVLDLRHNVIKTPDFFLKPAVKVYDAWHILCDQSFIDRKFYWGNTLLQPPKNHHLLIEYLRSCHSMIIDHRDQTRSLNSFVHYLREQLGEAQRGFLSDLFPEKRSISNLLSPQGVNYIRITSGQEKPLSIQEAGAVIEKLVESSQTSETSRKKNVLLTLGFSWICLHCSFRGIHIKAKNLLEMPLEISTSKDHTKYYLYIYTEKGKEKVIISKEFSEYLLAISYTHNYGKNYLYPPSDIDRDIDAHLKSHLNSMRRILSSIGRQVTGRSITFSSLLKSAPTL